MFEGPIIDTFLHGPWIGEEGEVERADLVPWTEDPRLQRVMKTFHHPDTPDGRAPRHDIARVLSDMDRAGVDKAVVCAKVYYPTVPEKLDALHQALLSVSKQSEGRLAWIATVVPPEHGPASYWDLMRNPRIIEALKDADGLVGVHITPSPWGLPPNDRWYYPLYAKCVELGLKLFTYVGMPGPLWPTGPNHPGHLEDVALAFPELVIIAHHIGDPWTAVSVRLAARHPNFYICTSAWHPAVYPASLMQFLRGRWHGQRGSEKVLFASDYPLLDMEKTTLAARQLELPDADLRNLLYENARNLLFQESGSPA